MTLNYNVTGAKRKELVQLISNFTGCDIKYKGAPSFAYEVDYFTIDRNGTISFDDKANDEVIERLMEMLYDNGFETESLPEPGGVTGIAIQMPMSGFTESSLQNLFDIIEAKGSLIKKAFDIDDLPVNLMDNRLDFPWFSSKASPEEVRTYMHFITALCELAKKQRWVTVKDKEIENEKYAFRCFLLRLGFIGDEYKEMRKILLRNLEGSSAFKHGRKCESEENTNA